MGRWLLVLLWIVALVQPGQAQIAAPIAPDYAPSRPAATRRTALPITTRRTPRRASSPRPGAAQAGDPKYALVKQFLLQLDQGRWAAGLLSAEFRDEIENEFVAGRSAPIAPGGLGKLLNGRYLPGEDFNYAVETRPASSTLPRILRLRLIPVLNQWQIDGFDSASMHQSDRRSYRTDTGLPTSSDRLFNTVRLLKLPPLSTDALQAARKRIVELYQMLDDPDRDTARLQLWFGPRMRARLHSDADFDRLLKVGNLGTLRVVPGEIGGAMVRIELRDGQGELFRGAAFLTVTGQEMLIDALDYFDPKLLDSSLP
ncbi:hypothetical protein [Gloeobacter kilaueensis]|uniref:Uncharacterized protein n=1 Tax=Gloeobacter kilaueensis (strain ATCC BAA-2537 / CCAP 1431/1 / ULC 316 / JS1) TaxID=1183438 RepID=U5QC82_GLOK1|nr:hypothetical protein [Gloeobacter kilaueensis]AGY56466.1 hypothetical protein GKIL_0219 [Gloeobacter kilaueensis JS1]